MGDIYPPYIFINGENMNWKGKICVIVIYFLFLSINLFAQLKKTELIESVNGITYDLGTLFFSAQDYFTEDLFLSFQGSNPKIFRLDKNMTLVEKIDSIDFYKKIENGIEKIKKVVPSEVLCDQQGRIIYFSKDYPYYFYKHKDNNYDKISTSDNDTNKILVSCFTQLKSLFYQKNTNFYYLKDDSLENYSIINDLVALIPNYFSKYHTTLRDTIFYINGDWNLVKFGKGEFKVYPQIQFSNNPLNSKINFIKSFEDSVFVVFFDNTISECKILKYYDGIFHPIDLTEVSTPGNKLQIPNIHAFEIDSLGRFWLIMFDRVNPNIRYLWVYENEIWKNIDINTFGFADSLELQDRMYSMNSKIILTVRNKRTNSTNYLIFRNNFLGLNDFEVSEKMPDIYLERIFPNPTTNLLKVKFSIIPSKIQETKFKLVNSLGQSIGKLMPSEMSYDSQTGKALFTINLSNYPKGLFYLIISDDETTCLESIIIK